MVSLEFWDKNLRVPAFPFSFGWIELETHNPGKEATVAQQWTQCSPVASGKDTLQDTTTRAHNRGEVFLQRNAGCSSVNRNRH